MAEDSEIPFPSGVVQSGSGSGSNLNRYQDDPEIEGFPSGSGENETSLNLLNNIVRFKIVLQSGSGSGSNLNRYKDDPEVEGFPSGSGNNESSLNLLNN